MSATHSCMREHMGTVHGARAQNALYALICANLYTKLLLLLNPCFNHRLELTESYSANLQTLPFSALYLHTRAAFRLPATASQPPACRGVCVRERVCECVLGERG